MPDPISRRRALVIGAGTIGAAATIATARGQTSSAAKQSKADAQYQDKPHDGQLCGICTYFVAPTSCQKVEGEVRPTGWCKNFQRKT
jgi:hypothetical protein